MMGAMKKLSKKLTYDASADAVAAMLDDPAFREAVSSASASSAARSPSTATWRGSSRCAPPTTSRPSPRSSSATRSTSCRPRPGPPRTAPTWSSPSPASRARRSARCALVESGDTTTETVELDVKVKIPLVGGKIEGLIADMLGHGARRRAPGRRGVARAADRRAGPPSRRQRPRRVAPRPASSRRRTRTTSPSTTNGPKASSSVSACSTGCRAPGATAGGGRGRSRPHPPPPRRGRATSAHVRVAVVLRRDERLLDRARRGPAQQVDRGAGLVVGARGPAAAERLLADDRAGRLVVDVEVAGREAQRLARPRDRRAGPGR